jgi:hypothetical protein
MNRSVPARDEAADYYFRYIDLVPETDVVGVLERQLPETLAFLGGISDEKSKHRYAPEKWSIRQLVSHVCDTERVMVFRAFWFGRGFTSPLPAWDEKPSAEAAKADEVPWASLLDEIQAIRLSTLAFFRSLPDEAWDRAGEASGKPFTVRALAYIVAGHLVHHETVLKERYF